MLHNGLGYLLGFWASKLLQLPYADCKAVAVEVGMQNSGLKSTAVSAFCGIACYGGAERYFLLSA